jgi:flavin reductase (DIM6/NTAB) family NADH-FMN oxidoreductase RutF
MTADLDCAGVTSAELRQAMGHFATGVAVITSVAADGKPAGTTASAVSSLSLDPPLILVCLDQASLTLRAVRSHGAFGVNVLADHQQHLSAHFARRGAAAGWDGIAYQPGSTGSPRLADVLTAVECQVDRIVPGGDHEIVIGRVTDIAAGSVRKKPLVHWRGQYADLGQR